MNATRDTNRVLIGNAVHLIDVFQALAHVRSESSERREKHPRAIVELDAKAGSSGATHRIA